MTDQFPSLDELIESARKHKPTNAERRAHAISFAFGNVKLHNPAVTREMIERAYAELHPKEAQDMTANPCTRCQAPPNLHYVEGQDGFEIAPGVFAAWFVLPAAPGRCKLAGTAMACTSGAQRTREAAIAAWNAEVAQRGEERVA